MHSPKILVVGDLMVDHYIWGSCDRISPEAPVQVIKAQKETKKLGGAGNVISNLKALGAQTGIISVVGDDEIGQTTISLLDKLEVCYKYIKIERNRESSQKSRVMAAHQQVIRIDKESICDIKCEDEIINSFENCINKFDLVLLSDYGKGVLSEKICQNLIQIAKANKKMVLIDPKGSNYKKYKGATLLTPNKKEASEATRIQIKDKNSLKKAIKKLKFDLELHHSIITISEDGIALYDDELEIFPALAREVFDVTGAGDSVLAALGFCLARGDEIKSAIKTANLAAAVVVAKLGSANATFEEIEEISRERSGFARKIKSSDEVAKIVHNSHDKKIVFTNGCFDILHLGHIKYLQSAKSFGDKLIVGLNSDDSIKRLKGESRPINSQNDRASLLAALEFVDYVVIFNEDTPLNLIKKLKPDILVKGADYEGKEVVGSAIVSDVRLVEFIDGKSTTNLINKIKVPK